MADGSEAAVGDRDGIGTQPGAKSVRQGSRTYAILDFLKPGCGYSGSSEKNLDLEPVIP
jgi:hypothetical protein